MRSMTGFGKAEGKVGGGNYSIEVRSVNHRYLDARFRLHGSLNAFEIPLSETLRSHFDRGSFEVTARPRIPSQGGTSSGTRFVIDDTAMRSFMEAAKLLHSQYGTEKIPTLQALASTGKIFVPADEGAEGSEALTEIKTLFESALMDLKKMRESEGRRLETVLKDGLIELSKHVEAISLLAPEQPRKVKEKLTQKISQWQVSAPVDSSRLEWEVAFYAERSDVTEEIDRLRMHLKEFMSLISKSGSIGRKLDFLSQELHREVNTLASKATLIEITRLAVESKTQIEKLREQVQNVE